MIDLAVAQNAYDNYAIDDIGWVPTTENIADAFTKMGTNKWMEEFLGSGDFALDILKWVEREKVANEENGGS